MNNTNNKIVFTVCNVAYLRKACVLAESIKKHNNLKLKIILFDKKREIDVDTNFCDIYWIEDFEIPNFKSLAFKYDVIELTTALKSWIALKFLENKSKLIFLDPDIMVFNSLNLIFDKLDSYPVVLTPHYFNPKYNGLTDDAALMRQGQYNLGFFAANSSKESINFLNWWSERCMVDCFIDTQGGLMNDQKWISIAPMFFPFIYTSYNPGLNVAFWNLDERDIFLDEKEAKYLVNKKYELIFFHFSSFNSSDPKSLTKRKFNLGSNDITILSDLGFKYQHNLNKYINSSKNITYSFDYMSNGVYISPTLRRAYAAHLDEFSNEDDPFDANSKVYEFAKKNSLFQRKNTKYLIEGYDTYSNHNLKFKIVYILMRFLLKLVGPNNFMNISRLFVYLSRYHKVKDLWKIK